MARTLDPPQLVGVPAKLLPQREGVASCVCVRPTLMISANSDDLAASALCGPQGE